MNAEELANKFRDQIAAAVAEKKSRLASQVKMPIKGLQMLSIARMLWNARLFLSFSN